MKHKLEFMIPFQINVTHAQQDKIPSSEFYIIMATVVPLRIMLLCMRKGYLYLLHLLDYIAYVLLSTFA